MAQPTCYVLTSQDTDINHVVNNPMNLALLLKQAFQDVPMRPHECPPYQLWRCWITLSVVHAIVSIYYPLYTFHRSARFIGLFTTWLMSVSWLEVSVGPYCTVGSSVKVGNGCELYPSSHIFGNTELGESCVLMTGAVVVGDELPGYTVIGGNNIIGHHAVVGVKCQHLKYKHGDDCFFCCSIHRSSTSSETALGFICFIGDNNLIMVSCHIAHDCKIGDHNIFANNTLLNGHVIVQV
ncbi:hypothetical protein Bca52824_089687 [Brassica carinata]|uniref:Uncharacterized protein n=1 Tax=Brassica carinata TaxID=52824 RepID=A0A8X7PI83_BRACI|nr:hypothetical protein Bca52824_089687 [Brassica carinata]